MAAVHALESDVEAVAIFDRATIAAEVVKGHVMGGSLCWSHCKPGNKGSHANCSEKPAVAAWKVAHFLMASPPAAVVGMVVGIGWIVAELEFPNGIGDRDPVPVEHHRYKNHLLG